MQIVDGASFWSNTSAYINPTEKHLILVTGYLTDCGECEITVANKKGLFIAIRKHMFLLIVY